MFAELPSITKRSFYTRRRCVIMFIIICCMAVFCVLKLQCTNRLDKFIIEFDSDSLRPDCRHFLHHTKHPTVRFLGPKEIITDRKELMKLQKAIPQQINFMHFNNHFRNPRYLCGIESAAKQNPNHKIIVHAKNETDFETQTQKWIQLLGDKIKDRLSFERLDWAPMFEDTPLQQWWADDLYKESKWVDQNLGNAYRLALLWKRGGIYLDSDIISINPLSGMGRSVAMQRGPRIMNNAYFSFPEQDLFVWDMMEEFVLGFNGSKWGNNGPRMVERTYNKYCANSNPEEKADECNGLGIADPPRFFPVPYSKRNQIALPWTSHCQLMKFLADESIGVHWFNKYYKTLGIPKNSVLGTLMQLHCPSVVEAFTPTGLGFVEDVGENTFPEEAKEWMGWEKDDGF